MALRPLARFFAWMRRRDPGASQLRQQWMNLEQVKAWHQGASAICLVLGVMIYEQTMDPSSVRLPIQDGRSGVT